MAITISVDFNKFQGQMLATEKALRQVTARTLTRVAYDIRDEERFEVQRRFEFASGSTRTFLSGRGSFTVLRATPSRLVAWMFPKPKTAQILVDHVQTTRIFFDRERLGLGAELAVPIAENVPRNLQGKVSVKSKPGALLQRGFVKHFGSFSVLFSDFAPKARKRVRHGQKVRAARGEGQQDYGAAFILIHSGELPSARTGSHIRYETTAILTAVKQLPLKFRREILRQKF